MTCGWDHVFWHWPMYFSLESPYCLDFIVSCTDSRDLVPDAAKRNQNITEPPCFTVGKCVLDMLHFSICEHRADVPWREVVFLSHLFIGHSPRSFVACQHGSLENSSLAFLCLIFNNGVLFGSLPLNPLWLKWQMVRSDTDVLLLGSSSLISFEVFFFFFSELLCYHLYYQSLWFVVNFPPVPTSRETGYTPTDLKFMNMCNLSYRNIKHLGDGSYSLYLLIWLSIISSPETTLSFASSGPYL